MQIEIKKSFHQSFGGINFLDADLRRSGFRRLITEHLGHRSINAQYSYSDVIKNLFFMFSIGGDVLDDMNTLREQMQDHPWLRICSPDTVEYVCGELRQPAQVITTGKEKTHYLNEHAGFNRLFPALCLQGGIL